jgi:hypothetical protein
MVAPCPHCGRVTDVANSALCGFVNQEPSVSCSRRHHQQPDVTRCLSEAVPNCSILCWSPAHLPITFPINSTACYFHIINVGITKAITLGLMTEAEQGVKHDARRRRVVIDGSASHMMGSSLPDRGCLYSLPLKFQVYDLPGKNTGPSTLSPLPRFN